MVLVDSSVWVSHFRQKSPKLEQCLERELVLMHPLVIGELACGNLHHRSEVLARLGLLPQATAVSDTEALSFIESHRLMGTGIGYHDIHLLASARPSAASLWTLDTALGRTARRLDLHFHSEKRS